MRKLSFLFLVATLSLVSANTFAKAELALVITQEDKVEIKIGELPKAVIKTLSTEFAEFTIEKAYKATIYNKEVFYLKLVKNGRYAGATINADGTVVGQKTKNNQS